MEIKKTKIDGLLEISLDIFEDERGSFREVWQFEKMESSGLPSLKFAQASISESKKGVIRGIHAEPWDKYIHIASGEAFAAILDMRKDSPTFGQYETFELNQRNAIFVPKGLGNSFQALSERVVYSYLVTDVWRPDTPYVGVAYDDPDLAIPWPIKDVIVSEKDKELPRLKEHLAKLT